MGWFRDTQWFTFDRITIVLTQFTDLTGANPVSLDIIDIWMMTFKKTSSLHSCLLSLIETDLPRYICNYFGLNLSIIHFLHGEFDKKEH